MDDTVKLYNKEEQEIIDYVLNKRKAMVEEIFKDGIPKDVGTARVVNEILSGMEGQVESAVKLKLSKNKDDNNTMVVNMVAALLTQVNEQIINKREEDIPELIGDEKDVEVVEGETDLDPEPLDVASFVEN